MMLKALIGAIALCAALVGVISIQQSRLNTLRANYDNVLVKAENCHRRIDDVSEAMDDVKAANDIGAFDALGRWIMPETRAGD